MTQSTYPSYQRYQRCPLIVSVFQLPSMASPLYLVNLQAKLICFPSRYYVNTKASPPVTTWEHPLGPPPPTPPVYAQYAPPPNAPPVKGPEYGHAPGPSSPPASGYQPGPYAASGYGYNNNQGGYSGYAPDPYPQQQSYAATSGKGE